MPIPAHEHQLRSRVWINLDCVLKDFGEYFYGDEVRFVTRRWLMAFVTGQQMMIFVEGEWEEGGCAIEGQTKVARVEVSPVEVRPIEDRIHG